MHVMILYGHKNAFSTIVYVCYIFQIDNDVFHVYNLVQNGWIRPNCNGYTATNIYLMIPNRSNK